MSENSGAKLHTMYIILILALIGGLVFTNVKLRKSKTDIETVTTQKTGIEKLKNDLQVEYDKALADLDLAKNENLGLEDVIQQKQAEIEAKKNQIAQILSQGNGSKAELEKARRLIDELTADRVRFQGQIDSLIAVNKQLEYEKVVLNEEKSSLTASLDEEKSVRSQVEGENKQMKEKINRASILSAMNMTMSGVSTSKKGKEVIETKAKNADKLKICFDFAENKIAPSGETEVAIRLISPDGVTITNAALGSGTSTTEKGQEVQYTYKVRPDYDNQMKKVCSLWDQGGNFAKGTYNVEVYQKGILIGQTSAELK